MKKIVFACVHNAGRSQIAAAVFNALADPSKAVAISAGTQPALEVHPLVVEVMREVGVDLTAVSPQKLTPELASGSAFLVTLGCGEDCPVVPGALRLDWPIQDPKGEGLESVRRIRDQVSAKVVELIKKEGWQASRKGKIRTKN